MLIPLARTAALLALLWTLFHSPVTAQPTRCIGSNSDQCQSLPPGTSGYNERLFQDCPSIRTLDGSCTNDNPDGLSRVWGSAQTAHFSYFSPFSTKEPTGQNRNSPRLISNVVSAQNDYVPNDRGLTEFLVFVGQFLDHNIVQTALEEDEPFNIPIPRNDRLFGNFSRGQLPFSRSERVPVSLTTSEVRPANMLSSAIDLAAVYSSNEERLRTIRVGETCFLQTSSRDFLPRNNAGLVNDPDTSARFFLAGDVRSNENPMLTAMHTIFLREHNRLCQEVAPLFRNDDEAQFQAARLINIAQFQKIIYEEFFPAITGRRLKRYTGFKRNENLGVSLLFSTAAFRIGHTMIGNALRLRGPGNKPLRSFPAREMFFRTADLFEGFDVEPFIRGAVAQQAQEVDTLVQDSLREVLFANVEALDDGVDLVALNLQRGRDHALPNFNTVRRRFRLRPVKRFRGLTSNLGLQNRLSTVYRKPDDIDIWIALLAEDHEPRSSLGATMLRIWVAEFTRLRDGDRFFYERRGHFSKALVKAFPRLAKLRKEKNTMRRIILRNSNIASSDLQQNIFRAGRMRKPGGGGGKRPGPKQPQKPKTPKPEPEY